MIIHCLYWVESHSEWFIFFQFSVLEGVPSLQAILYYNVSLYINATRLDYLKKQKHISVKEVQLKLTEWQINKITSFTQYQFFLLQVHSNEHRFLRRLIMGDVHIFLPFKGNTEYLAQLFNVIIRVFHLFVMGNLRRLNIFSRVLKPAKPEEAFQKINIGIVPYY